MRRTGFLTTCMLSAAVAALSVSACSSDPDETEGEGGSAGTGGTTSSTTTPTNTNTGTGTGDGNDTFETATPMNTGEDTFGTLEAVDVDVDFYRFSGNAGDLIFIDTAAKPETDPFSNEYPDLVVTLYDSAQQQIAENDDPFLNRDTNDSEIYTVLPATGDYYIRVQDCLTWEGGGVDNCSPAADIIYFDYGLRVTVIDNTSDDVTLDPENGNDETTAAATAYTEESTGNYYASLAYGGFADNADIDVFSISLPPNLAFTEAPMLNVTFVGPEGPTGCGTTNNVGMTWVEDGAGTVVSSMDHSLNAVERPRRLRAPMPVDTQHYLFVQHPGGTAGANDFYILLHSPSDSNPLEAQEAANGDPATPEALTGSAVDTAYGYFVQGTMADGDEDHYLVDGAPASGFDTATWTLSVACGAQRSGSGLRALSAEVLGAAAPHTPVPNATGTETAADDLFVDDVALGGESQFVVKLSGGTADATVSSRFYMCGIYFSPPVATQ